MTHGGRHCYQSTHSGALRHGDPQGGGLCSVCPSGGPGFGDLGFAGPDCVNLLSGYPRRGDP